MIKILPSEVVAVPPGSFNYFAVFPHLAKKPPPPARQAFILEQRLIQTLYIRYRLRLWRPSPHRRMVKFLAEFASRSLCGAAPKFFVVYHRLLSRRTVCSCILAEVTRFPVCRGLKLLNLQLPDCSWPRLVPGNTPPPYSTSPKTHKR